MNWIDWQRYAQAYWKSHFDSIGAQAMKILRMILWIRSSDSERLRSSKFEVGSKHVRSWQNVENVSNWTMIASSVLDLLEAREARKLHYRSPIVRAAQISLEFLVKIFSQIPCNPKRECSLDLISSESVRWCSATEVQSLKFNARSIEATSRSVH